MTYSGIFETHPFPRWEAVLCHSELYERKILVGILQIRDGVTQGIKSSQFTVLQGFSEDLSSLSLIKQNTNNFCC